MQEKILSTLKISVVAEEIPSRKRGDGDTSKREVRNLRFLDILACFAQVLLRRNADVPKDLFKYNLLPGYILIKNDFEIMEAIFQAIDIL